MCCCVCKCSHFLPPDYGSDSDEDDDLPNVASAVSNSPDKNQGQGMFRPVYVAVACFRLCTCMLPSLLTIPFTVITRKQDAALFRTQNQATLW